MGGLIDQFARFCSAGALATLGHYSVLILLSEAFPLGPVPAALAGYLVGGVISYRLSYRWVFASSKAHRVAVSQFVLVALVGFVATGLLMGLWCEGLGLHYLPAQVLTTGLVMLWSFWANRHWTFGDRDPAE